MDAAAEASGWLQRRRTSDAKEKAATSRGRFRKEIEEAERLTFGKYNGLTFREALAKDPGYALWCSEQPDASLGMRRFVQYAEDHGAPVAPAQKRQKGPTANATTEDGQTSSSSQARACPPASTLSATLEGFTFQPQPSPVRAQYRPSEAGGQPDVTKAGAAGTVPCHGACGSQSGVLHEQPELGFGLLRTLQNPLIQRPDLSQLQAPCSAAAMQPCGQAPAASTAYIQDRTQQPFQHELCVQQQQQQQQQGRLQASQPAQALSWSCGMQYSQPRPLQQLQPSQPQWFSGNVLPQQSQPSPHHQHQAPQPRPAPQPPQPPPQRQPPKGGPSPAEAWKSRLAVDDAVRDFDGDFEVELLGREGFMLRTSKKLPGKAYAALRQWPGAKTQTKRLHFESSSYKAVLQRLLDLQGPAKVQLPPHWVLAAVPNFRNFGRVQVTKKVAHVLLADMTGKALPEGAASREGHEVLPYQREAVNFALRRGGRVLLADEMGLGKTAQALTLCSQFPSDFPLLVVCPSSLRGNWREEASRWLPSSIVSNPDRHIQVVRKGSDKLRREARVVIVSYDLIAQQEAFQQSAHGKKYRVVICDEAHFLKTPSSQRSKALRPILQETRRCALLTGTPALAKASELYSLLDCLLPGVLPTHNEFCKRYCNEKTLRLGKRHVKQWEGCRLGDELYAVLDAVMVRRFKKEVLSQLPAKRRQRVVLDRLSNEQGVLKELREKMSTFGRQPEEGDLQGGKNGAAATELFRLTGLAKVDAVAEYVQYLVEAECRFLLFAHHQAVMDTLQQKLEKLKAGFIRIDGKTPSHQREQLVNEFRSNPAKQVALLSITACGQGLNLQVCSTVVFAELHWTPGTLLQAEDRAHRMGQQESVNVHYLIAKDTLDESVYQMLERKQHDVGVMVDGQASKIGAENVGSKGTFSTTRPVTETPPEPESAESAEAAEAAGNPNPPGAQQSVGEDPRQLRLFFPRPKEAGAEDAGEDSWVSEPVSIDVD